MASLEDRVTKVEDSQTGADPPSSSDTASSVTPAAPEPVQSWADETAAAEDESKPTEVTKSENEMNDLPQAQTDGATEPLGGTSGIYEPDYEVDVKLSDLQGDAANPLHSIKSFEELGLDEKILEGIYQMRFTKPSKIQEKALPLLLRNPPQNMIGQSQSGTGKTAAFVLNILARLDLSGNMAQSPQALVLAPSRELARQIVGVCQVMGQSLTGLTVETAVPVERAERSRQIRAPIVIGTPGTTTDLIKRRQLNVQHLKVLVLDEADNMLDQQGLGDQCHRVRQMLPKTVQVVLFSATFPDRVVDFAGRFAPNSNQITLRHEELTIEGIKQLYLDCPSETDKFDAIVRLYGLMTIGSSIIFVRTRKSALELEQRLNADNHTVACLTGDFEGAQRDIIIDAFRTGRAKVLITTNVLSRGIDVQTVSLVINYDLPDDNHGVSISLIHGRHSYKMIQQIQDYFAVQMTALPHDDWDRVEEIIKKVIKSSRAGTNFKTTNDAADMNT
ncbi:RNA helicase required for poly(A+) mRNA export [Puttea exsequens]|nr:RNA helicase required for poly(A+) mRNA export [Puttea exsequens]